MASSGSFKRGLRGFKETSQGRLLGAFQESYKGISGSSKEFQDVLGRFRWLQGVPGVFRCISEDLKGFPRTLRILSGGLQEVSMVLQGCVNGILGGPRKFHGVSGALQTVTGDGRVFKSFSRILKKLFWGHFRMSESAFLK